MIRRDAAGGRSRGRAHRTALLSATMLATGFLNPVEAAKFGIVVNAVQDPLLANLAIPEAAPSVGMWSGVRDWPMNAIHMGLLPSGKVVSFGTGAGNPGTQDGRSFDIWDPYAGLAGNSHVNLPGTTRINSFCAAQAFLADGSLLVSGGIFDDGNDRGSAVLNNAANGVSAVGAQLANDRYYSTMLTLPNGQQVIVGGSYPYLGGWADPQGSIDKGWMTGMTPEVFDGQNWRSLFGAKSRDAFGPDYNRFWYPRAWIAPNGKVFGISSEKMWYLDTANNGSVTTQQFKQGQRDVGNAADAPNVGPASTAVMYAPGKILQVGGNAYSNGEGFRSSSRASVIDINGNAPAVNDTNIMNFGRAWANATVLPTGVVAVTGGSKYNDRGDGDVVLASEFWDPNTGRWSVGASGSVYRGYHSSAILLQNGALLVAGGGAPGPVTNQNAEFFYPPYLFTTVNGKAALAPRPQIVSLNTNRLQYGQSMQFEFASQNGVAQVVLIGVSQVTHSFNFTQRRIPVTFSQADQTVTLQPPASGAVAPPGYYQLVAIDQKGVPSPGVIVAVGNVAAPPQSSTPIVGTAAGSGSGTGSTAGGRHDRWWHDGRWNRHGDRRNGHRNRDGSGHCGQPAGQQLSAELPHQRRRRRPPRHAGERRRASAIDLPDGRRPRRLGRVVPVEHGEQPVSAPPELPDLPADQRQWRRLQARRHLHPARGARRLVRLQHRNLRLLRVARLAGLLRPPSELQLLHRQVRQFGPVQAGRLVLLGAAALRRRWNRRDGQCPEGGAFRDVPLHPGRQQRRRRARHPAGLQRFG